MRRRTILVTGSSGRLGAPLALALGKDHHVIQLDVREPSDSAQHDLGPLHLGSITDPAFVAQAMESVDTVVHCAAIPGSRKPYPELLNINVMGTFYLLEEAGRRNEVEQFIYISSLMWHGLSEPPFDHVPHYLPINEKHPSLAVDYYACSKVQAEYWCEKYVQRFRKPVVVIRPPYIVALHEQPHFTARPAPAYPYLNDYVGVTDLIDGIVRAIDYEPPNGFDQFLLHAADQRSTTPSLDLVERFWPNVAIDRGKLSAYDGFGAFIDTAHAEDRLNWKPAFRCQR